MTTLSAKAPGTVAGVDAGAALSLDTRLILARLHEQSARLVPFSEAKRLLRGATLAIERLQEELTRVTAELQRERAGR